jgi:hypothetical protein
MVYFDRSNFADNTKFEEKEVYIYIPTDANFNDVKKIVAPIFCKWIVLKGSR